MHMLPGGRIASCGVAAACAALLLASLQGLAAAQVGTFAFDIACCAFASSQQPRATVTTWREGACAPLDDGAQRMSVHHRLAEACVLC